MTDLGRHPYTKYSAIRKIVDENRPDAVYACSDLLEAARKGSYENPNEDWRAAYDSVVVVPICDFGQKDLSRTYGFLCLDSRSGDVSDWTVQKLMQLFARYFFRAFDLVSILTEESGRDEGSDGEAHEATLSLRLRNWPQDNQNQGGFTTSSESASLAPVNREFQRKLGLRFLCLAKTARQRTLNRAGSPGAQERSGEFDLGLRRTSQTEVREMIEDNIEYDTELQETISYLASLSARRAKFGHPSLELQETYALDPDSLSADERGEIESHLEGCDICKSTRQQLIDNPRLYAQL